MAEDVEKKQEFILTKKEKSSAPEPSSEKTDKPKAQQQDSETSHEKAPVRKKVVVKAKPKSVQSHGNGSSSASAASDRKSASYSGGNAERRKVSSFELNPQRPNVKAGNLSDKPRFSGNQRRDNNGNYQRRDNNSGGFTGAQAREGYRNRSNNQNGGQGGQRNNYNGGQRGGFNGQGNRNNSGNGQRGNYGGGQNGQRNNSSGRMSSQGGFNNRGGFGGGMPPSPVEENKKSSQKKSFKGKKPVYNRKDREDIETVDKLLNQKKKQTIHTNPVPKEIEIMDSISVSELAKKMNLKASEIISKLMGMGMMVSITQTIDADTATIVASEFDCQVKIISLYDETVIESEADKEEDMLPRPPVVTVMGHVDHGKTKTLDAIRSANVVASEFGGITQHIGAYQVETPKGKITFLDTPGHEAFTMMRARGAKVTDIVVLVVAADDGVMPQTVEAINHAKDAGVPIIVAVNKIDKPEANPDRVKTQLSEYDLTPEEWGGQTQYVYISALKKQGIDELLDAILLQAEVLELKANWNCRAEGKVIESKIDHGRGVVCTVMIERGTLHINDPYVGGIYAGHVRAIYNDRGKKLKEAYPAMPVEIVGFEGMPNAGDPFQVTETERDARDISAKRQELKRFEDSKAVKKVNLDNLYDTIEQGEVMELKVIIKADVQGSAEALKQSLEKLSTKDIRLVVIHSSAGAINESDVSLAAADSNAIIIGFNVRPTPKAKALADQEKVDIRKYNIIYKCVEEITAAMEGMLKPDMKEEVIGTVEVRDTFKVPKVGVIAGCYVLTGIVKRSCSVNVIRDGIVIASSLKISSLKRFKDDVKEVATSFECGIGLENWQDIQVGDQFEIIEMVEVARKLNAPSSSQAKKED